MAKAKKEDAATKTCAITREQFTADAKPMMANVNESIVVLSPKEFATGTLGWFANGTTVVVIDGVPCKVTFQVQMFVANSKDAK